MKKLLALVVMMIFLSGCSLQTFETVDDPNDVSAMATPADIILDLPKSAAVSAMQGTTGKIYFCGDYDLYVEILPSGNLDATLKTLTGYETKDIELLQTQRNGTACYEGAWSAVGEAGDHIGRVLILDDGSFHYCVSVMAMADSAGNSTEEWNAVLASVTLSK